MTEAKEDSGDRNRSTSEASENEYDPQYSPVISLPEVVVPTNEEEEEVLLNVRAKLYRFDRSDDIPEWKERGTGVLKMLKHPVNKTVRIVMRRDKTLKVCANHFITPFVELKPKPGHDKTFVYTVPGDFSDEQIKMECLAIRFGSVDIANLFKRTFSESQAFVREECKLYNGASEEEDDDEEDDSDSASEENNCQSSNDKENTIPTSDTTELNKKMKNLDVAKENGD